MKNNISMVNLHFSRFFLNCYSLPMLFKLLTVLMILAFSSCSAPLAKQSEQSSVVVKQNSNPQNEFIPRRLIYVYDPLCGWCFGFSPVMKMVEKDFGTKFLIEVLPGGMMLGENAGSINDVAPFIKTAYRDVENYTGVKFGETFVKQVLMPGTRVLNSELPCMAHTFFCEKFAERSVEIAHDIQQLMYVDGADLNLVSGYAKMLLKYNISQTDFNLAMNKEQLKSRTYHSFALVQKYGISGFPALLFDRGDSLFVIAKGYTNYKELKTKLDSLL